MKKTIPAGLENSIGGRTTPDIQSAFQIFATHWRRVNGRWNYPEHAHSMFEINIVLDGEQRMTVDGHSFLQSTGDILFIRPGARHSSDGSPTGKDMEYFCLHFDIDDLALRRSLLAMETDRLQRNMEADAALRHALNRMIDLTKQLPSDSRKERLIALSASFQLLSALSERALSDEIITDRTSEAASEHAVHLASAIERELHHILQGADRTGERTGIEKIAAKLGYSSSYCNRVFQQVYGTSPRQYLSGLIIRQAKLLLMDRELSVEEIATRLGYRDVAQFSKQFKRWMNLSPAGYRRLTH